MNRFVIVVFASAFVTTCVKAQTSSGNKMVGGSFSFTSYSYSGASTNDGNTVSFSPGFGYFIKDNFAIGTSLALSTTRNGTGAGKSTSSAFGLSPFARYYKFTSNESFAFFGEAGLSFGFGKTDPAIGEITKSNSIAFWLSPGAAYFFNEHWALELSITGLVISSSNPDTRNDNNKVTRVTFDVSSWSPTLGFRYHF